MKAKIIGWNSDKQKDTYIVINYFLMDEVLITTGKVVTYHNKKLDGYYPKQRLKLTSSGVSG